MGVGHSSIREKFVDGQFQQDFAMNAKKLAPILIASGLVLVITAFIMWFKPPMNGEEFNISNGIIPFLIGLGANIKGWIDLLKKDEPTKSETSYTATQSGNGAIVQGKNLRAVGSQGVMAEEVKGIINYGTINQTVEPPSPSGNGQDEGNNTLPTQPFFFGRESELRQIYEALRPEVRTWGVLITGPGGIGKTALAIYAAEQSPDVLFEKKLFISAKIRKLTPDGEVGLSDFAQPTYLGMLTELAKQIGEKEITIPSNTNFVNDLWHSLANKKYLIIFDNLETLPATERKRLYAFLSNLPKPNKAIATSRRYPSDPDVRIITLGFLSHDDSMKLLTEYQKNYHRLQKINFEDLSKLCKITNGNPCLINWIAGQLGNENSGCYTLDDAYQLLRTNPSNDPLEYIFGDLLDSMTDKELVILDALSWFEKPAKVQWISEMIKTPEDELDLIFYDLTKRSIIIPNSEATLFTLPVLAKEYIKQQSTIHGMGDE